MRKLVFRSSAFISMQSSSARVACKCGLQIMRVGISINTRLGEDIWSNEVAQSIHHLATLIHTLPFVEMVYLVACGGQNGFPASAVDSAKRFPIITLVEATDILDLAIEVGACFDSEWICRYRARGGRVAYSLCMQPYAELVDCTTFNKPGYVGFVERYDEIWLAPRDEAFAPMLRALHRCPVFVVPYVWSPSVLKESIASLAAESLSFGYAPGSLCDGNIRPAIFEPNLSPIRTGLIPYLICEEMERHTPGAIDEVRFLNTAGFAAHPTFAALVNNTNICRRGAVKIEGRDYFTHVMARGANVVISHQFNCIINYLYYDALYGGYPLVHNSPAFADIGYYYPGSDVEAGLACLQSVISNHDHFLEDYLRRAHAKIASVSPHDSSNQAAYAKRILALRWKNI